MDRIMLLTPNWKWDESPLAVDTLRPPVSPPLEWSYLAPALGDQLVDVLDAYALDLDLEGVMHRIRVADPNVLVVSTAPSILYWRCPPMSVRAPRALTGALRSGGFDGRILLVGPHGTHDPAFALAEGGGDAVWRGSTDRLLGPTLVAGEWRSSPYVYAGVSSVRTQIAVDQGPFVPSADYSVFTPEHYAPHMWLVNDDERSRAAAYGTGALAEASRGCPWSCSYCSKAPVRDHYGRRNLELLAREIRQAKRLGWQYLFFIDETFNLPSSDWRALLSVLREQGMAFGFQGRPDLIDDAMARLLAESGCVYAELGVDLVGDELSRAAGRGQQLAVAERGLEACQRHVPIVRFNRLNSTTLDYVDMHFGTVDKGWDEPADPIYPYPTSEIGNALMKRYGRDHFDWEFAERYSWWLRIEVFIQRKHTELSDSTVRSLKDMFLAADKSTSSALATLLDGIQIDQMFLEKNKAVLGAGGKLHINSSSV